MLFYENVGYFLKYFALGEALCYKVLSHNLLFQDEKEGPKMDEEKQTETFREN